jgi:hypothetical protein
VRSAAGEYRSGVGLNERVNDRFGYRIGIEHDTRDKQVQSTVGASLLPRYSQLELELHPFRCRALELIRPAPVAVPYCMAVA